MQDPDIPRVRFASREDNDALCELASCAPMVTNTVVASDRSPDFFALYDLHGDSFTPSEAVPAVLPGYFCAVAESDGKLVAALAVSFRKVRWEDRTVRLAYPMDARVAPDYRGRGLFKALWSFCLDVVTKAEVDIVAGLVLHGNKPGHHAATEHLPNEKVAIAGEFHLLHFSLHRPYKEPRGLLIDRASDEDRDEVAGILNDSYRYHRLAPVMDRAWLDRTLERSAGYGMEEIRVARQDGKIVALVGLWDQAAIRRLIVLQNPPLIRAAITAARIIHQIIPSPPPPEVGKPLTNLFIKQIAYRPGYEETLRGMMRIILNQTRRQREHALVWGAFFQNDPCLKLWKGFTKTTTRSTLYYYTPAAGGWRIDPESVRRAPIYADFSMV